MTPRQPAAPAAPKLPCGRPRGAEHAESAADARQLLDSLLARLDAFVAERGLNRSETRRKILETIVREARHFRALDLLERLKVRHPQVGKATLYRTLPVLVESGVIQEGPTDSEGQTLYELADEEHHDHIVCLDCRRIFEFHDDDIERRQDAVAARLGFSTRSHRHVVYARCDYLAGRGPR
jgi:Fur family ferric uptake transcriptional regulator